jgi:PQQ-dependent dehydrogenase (methanol/ethanol family)
MMRMSRGIGSLFTIAVLGAGAVRIAGAQQARRVDDAALKDAAKTGEEWISYNLGWSEQRYSPLHQIDAGNIGRLGLAWSYEIPAAQGRPQTRQEGTALVSNGIMYSIAPWSVVYAVDARTGKEVWHRDPDVNQQVWQSRVCCGVVNRGIALYEGKVIAPVIDGRLRALDAETGRILWETRVSPENMPYTITMAPRVIKGGKVIIGVSGGEYAVRGFFSAFDAETGKLAWQFYTVPGDPSKPFENPALAEAAKTWSGEWWKIGGGAPVWNGMAYDPDSDIVYVGTGQPGPWTEVSRGPGDNLYTDCILAVRGATGKLVWYYQEVPGDDWDYDSIADLMLADLPMNGTIRKVIMHAPKDGFFYVLDRRTGELLSADPWVTVTWASGVNLKTGRPVVNPEARYGKESVSVMPGPGGGHVWPPWSFNPTTGLVYIPSTIGGAYNYAANPDFVPLPTDIGVSGRGQMNMGTAFGGGGRGGRGGPGRGGAAGGANAALPPGVDAAAVAAEATPGRGGATPAAPGPPAPSPIPAIGPEGRGNILVAWDPVAKKERWRGLAAGYNQGGTLSTAGNLVFSSVNTRLLAYRADTGDQVLDLATGLSQMGPPMTFMLDGKQYIAVAGGPPQAPGAGRGGPGGGDGRGAATPPAPGAAPVQPSRMLVFVLDGKPLPPAPAAPPPGAPANR